MAFPSITPGVGDAILDNFNRAGPGLGANWTTGILAFGGSAMQIRASTLLDPCAAGSYGAGYYSARTFGQDVELYIDLPAAGGTALASGVLTQLFFRLTAGAANGYFLMLRYNNAGSCEWQFSISPNTQIGPVVDRPVVAGDKFGVRAHGSLLEAFHYTGGAWNQTPVISLVDTGYVAPGMCGVGLYSTSSLSTLDNFTAGTEGSAGSVVSGVGSSSGVATASATGRSTAASVGTSSGAATAAATGAKIAASVGTSSGIATAAATGRSTASSVGSSSGIATANAVSSFIGVSAAVGTSTGSATVLGYSPNTGANDMPDLNYLINWYVKTRTGTPLPTVSERKIRLVADAHTYYESLGLVLNTCDAEIWAYLQKLWTDSLSPVPTTPTYRSHTKTAFLDRSVTTWDRPADVVDGDLVLAIAVSRNAGAGVPMIPPVGFTQQAGLTLTADAGVNGFVYVWWKIANNEPPTYLTSHGSTRSMVYCVAVQKTHQTTPLSPAPTLQNRGANPVATSIAPSITTPIVNSLVIFWSQATDLYTGGALPPAGTTPPFTERIDLGPLYVADGVMAAAAATGNKSHTNPNVTGTQWGAGLISIRGV